MALAANALTTLKVVLDELSLTMDNGQQDARLEHYINAASDWVAQHCGRTLQRADAIAEGVKGFGGVLLRVARPPIVAITSIAIDGGTVDAAGYAVQDAERGVIFRGACWPWTAVARAGITSPQVPGWEDHTRIVVTYNGGWVTPSQAAAGLFSASPRTLPYQIEDACVRLVASRWRSRGTDGRLVSESTSNMSITFDGWAIPKTVLAALSPFAKYPVG